jgi:hypothetical protein
MTRRLLGLFIGVVFLGAVALWTTVQAQPATCQTFPQTGQTVCGRFLQYWREHGGLAQQGYPISGEFQEVSALDQRPYTVQYFERAVFELHPENQPPYDVLLSQLGTYQLRRLYAGGTPGDAGAALRARPLQLPVLTPGGTCPTTPGATVNPAFGLALGNGPLYPVGLGTQGIMYYGGGRQEGGWVYQKVLWVGRPTVQGPVLIRGHQLDGPNELRFAEGATPPAALQLQASAAGHPANTWYDWPSYTRIRAPGCYAYQVDGLDFTTIIFFKAVDTPLPP